jgi:YspA, cpYpsA-related SLOG family
VKIIVCGGRDFVDVPMLWRELDQIAANTPEPGIRLVIDGASDDVTGPYKGADYWAHQWALARNIPTVREHANWDQQGKAAGPIRNGEMLKRHTPYMVVAFPGGRGTSNMIDQAERAGVVVQRIRAEGLQRFSKARHQ